MRGESALQVKDLLGKSDDLILIPELKRRREPIPESGPLTSHVCCDMHARGHTDT